MTPQSLPGIAHDPTEAPAGYRAVPKADMPHDQGNLCQFCDWRPTCQDPATDFTAPGHLCMAYQRRDGVGSVFKKVKG